MSNVKNCGKEPDMQDAWLEQIKENNLDARMLVSNDKGQFWAVFPMFPGCHTVGDDLEQLKYNAKEALVLWLEASSNLKVNEVMFDDQREGYWFKIMFK